MKTKQRILRTALCLGLALTGGTAAQAQMVTVDGGTQKKVDAHNVCRIVVNGGGNDIMVPNRTEAEWSVGTNAFLTNLTTMDRVTAKSCDLGFSASGYSIFCKIWRAPVFTPVCEGQGDQMKMTAADANVYTVKDAAVRDFFWNGAASINEVGDKTVAQKNAFCRTKTRTGVYYWGSTAAEAPAGPPGAWSIFLSIHCVET